MSHIGTITFKDIYHVDMVLVHELPCCHHSVSVALKRECLMPSRKVSPVPSVSVGLLGCYCVGNVFECIFHVYDLTVVSRAEWFYLFFYRLQRYENYPIYAIVYALNVLLLYIINYCFYGMRSRKTFARAFAWAQAEAKRGMGPGE